MLALFLLGCAVLPLTHGEINNLPIVGILSVPYKVAPCDTFMEGFDFKSKAPHGTEGCFATFYASWLEQAGARVVPVMWDATTAQLDKQLSQINGVLFTGGGLDLSNFDSPYMRTANYIFQQAKKMYDKGDYFPIWGTCMGFQLLSILGAQNASVLYSHYYDTEDLSLALNFTSKASSSRLFKSYPSSIYKAFETEPITTNLHHDGVPPFMFTKNSNLSKIYNLLSINTGRKGHVFSSTLEGKKYPFYGTQWHPERPQYEFKPQNNISHTHTAELAMQYTADFFVGETRKNMHKYANPKEEDAALIYNYPVAYYGQTYQVYYV